jgi:2-keto-4-pentenoate hydratase/2-oxohepta-3-ene-1,7-dioic acid hydratase in catechol pathway
MRWARIEHGGQVSCGIVEGDRVALVEGGLLDGGRRTGRTVPVAEAKFLVPLVPTTFYAAGLNYVEHVMEVAKANNREPNIPPKPDIGYRANNALIGHGEAIVKPKDSTEKFQYEGELVAVIGRKAKNLSEADALSCVFGYTIGNDFSERTWQGGDRTLWRAKNTDTFKPMGPWIETDVDLDSLETTVRVNGKETIRFATNKMLFDIPTYIAAITKYVTLYPGDMIWMGTEGHSPELKAGDVCEIEISGIGVLSNPITREK